MAAQKGTRVEPKDVLKVFEETEALLTGHFELRSGLHSAHYFQCANVLRYPRAAARLCEALVAKLESRGIAGPVDGVIAPALGGILVGYEIARALDTLSIFAEKQDGKLVMRRFQIRPGQRLLVAEDVITRGGRVQETIDIVEQAGGRVAGIATLVDRSAGQASFRYPLCSLLEMAPVNYEPATCPLCAQGSRAVHPGS